MLVPVATTLANILHRFSELVIVSKTILLLCKVEGGIGGARYRFNRRRRYHLCLEIEWVMGNTSRGNIYWLGFRRHGRRRREKA